MNLQDAIKALYDHAVNYKPGTFSTSWGSYSIVTTETENLIDDVLKHSGEENPSYIKLVPKVLHDACAEYATTREQVENVGRFVGDMFANLTQMYIFEERGFAEDEEAEIQ